MDNIEKAKTEWFNENAPLGKDLGYPICCIIEFCDQPPLVLKNSKLKQIDYLRYEMAHINGKYTGFIPCGNHAKLIKEGKITLQQLITNRNTNLPEFPNY